MSSIEKVEYGSAVPLKPTRKLGNPGPLGLFSFASTTLILSLYNANARGVTAPNVVIGMALFVGGLAQLLAGMWEFAVGNTFGATAFSSYGGFWLSYASIFIPGSGISDAYKDQPAEFSSAVAIYLTTWAIVTFILLIGALRRNIGLITLFLFLGITFILLAAGAFTGTANISKTGGYLGVITALIAYYVGLAELLIRDESWFTLPLGQMPKRLD